MAENPGLSNSQSNHPFDYGYEHPIYPGNYNMVNSRMEPFSYGPLDNQPSVPLEAYYTDPAYISYIQDSLFQQPGDLPAYDLISEQNDFDADQNVGPSVNQLEHHLGRISSSIADGRETEDQSQVFPLIPNDLLIEAPSQSDYGEDDTATEDRSSNSDFHGDEDALSDDDNEEEESTNSGDFIVAAEECSSHTEKPGQTRNDKGFLEWLDPKTKRWHRACIHHNIRRHLIEGAKAKYPGQQYLFPMDAGRGPYDETAFHPDYSKWGSERAHWPNILFAFDPPKGHQPAKKPGHMIYDGEIVLNHQNNPVLDWDIPATLSSATPGCFLEAWKREFIGMSHQDLRARMVRFTTEVVKGREVHRPLNDKNSIINMPMQRFRDEAGCIAWLKRQEHIRAGLVKLMMSEGVDPRKDNSTKDFGRLLEKEEQVEVKKGDKAKFAIRTLNGRKKDASGSSGKTHMAQASSRTGPEESRKRGRENRDESLATTDNKGFSQRHFLPHAGSQDSPYDYSDNRPSKRGRTSQAAERGDEKGNSAATKGGEHGIEGPTINFVKQHRADMRARNKGKMGHQRTKISKVLRQTTGILNERSESRSESLGSHSMADPEVPEVEMSGSEFDNGEQSDTCDTDDAHASSEEPDQPHGRLRPTLRLPEYLGGPLPFAQDLENHRKRVSRYLGEEFMADDEVYPESLVMFEQSSPPQGGGDPKIKATSKAKEPRSRKARARVPTVDVNSRIDYSKVAPETEHECQRISEALMATREAYFEYTGHLAPTTNRAGSYYSQWEEIWAGFQEYDWSEEQDGEPPYLPKLMAWNTSVADWPPHVKDSQYYEAWTHGPRAPIGPDGEVIDMPGEFLEEIGQFREEERQSLLNDALRVKGYAVVPEDENEEEKL